MPEPVAADTRSQSCLFVAADLPWPPDGGGRIGTYRILEALSRRYQVDVVVVADPVGEPDLGPLPQICRSVEVVRMPFTFGRHPLRQGLVLVRSLLSSEPYRLRKFRNREFERLVRARLAERHYDLIDYDQFGVIPYSNLAPAGSLLIAGHHNVESDIYRLAARRGRNPARRLVAGLEAWKLRRAEGSLLNRFDHVFLVAPDDKALLADMGVLRTSVLPMPADIRGPLPEPPQRHRIISVGSMSWYGVADGLLWFHDEVLPLVRARVPDVEWELVGPNAPAAIRRLASEPSITVPGYVNDVDEYLSAARVGIVPLKVAGGIRQKLLYFMGLGLPSVSTSIGARGLAFEDGQGCYRRDDAAGFADAVVELLTSDEAWTQCVEEGRRFVASHHSQQQFDAAIDDGLRLARARHEREAATR
jgi:glycosyltransferase involved in cell wall biosynthesis